MPEQIIHRTEIPGIDLVPDSRHAMKYNNAEPWAAARDLQIGLRDVVEAVRDRYDMVLIDCPPNLHLCSWAALVASDFLIVPLQPEDYGRRGSSTSRNRWRWSPSWPTPACRSWAT